MSSARAIDAFVVATALEFDAAVIASADSADLARLAAPYRQISLLRL
jgi:predicted nucleic acid-binding protein